MSTPAPQARSRMPRIAGRLGEAAVERARLTVVPRRRTGAARVPFVTLVTLVLLGGVVGLLLFNTSMQQASFAATELQDQATNLAARQQTLMMELDQLRDPQHVALRAQKLGMVPAGNPAFIDLPSGRILGDPQPATRDDRFRIKPYPPHLPAALNPPPKVVKVIAPAHTGTGTTKQHSKSGSESRDTSATTPGGSTGAGSNG
jgi:hypothetical protein